MLGRHYIGNYPAQTGLLVNCYSSLVGVDWSRYLLFLQNVRAHLRLGVHLLQPPILFLKAP
jgi:hypothetical protein